VLHELSKAGWGRARPPAPGKGKEGAGGQEAEGQGCAEGKEKAERGSGGKEEEVEAEMEEDERLGEESRVEQGRILMKWGVSPHRAVGLYLNDNLVPDRPPPAVAAAHVPSHELAEASGDRDRPPAALGEGMPPHLPEALHAGVQGLQKGDVEVCVYVWVGVGGCFVGVCVCVWMLVMALGIVLNTFMYL
jgi:hypothetical protein